MNTITENHPYKRSLLGYLRPALGDRVLQAMLLMIFLLAIIDLPQVSISAYFTLQALWEMLPFFAIAIAIAAGAKASSADSLIAAAFSGNPLRATVLAALVGAISPFCSCGVIPLIAALLGAGVPLAPVMAFWIASPIMDPEMFILTVAGIGFNFAVAKTLAAIAMGLLAGFSILIIQRFGGLRDPLRKNFDSGCGSSGINTEARHCLLAFLARSGEAQPVCSRVQIDRYLSRQMADPGLFPGEPDDRLCLIRLDHQLCRCRQRLRHSFGGHSRGAFLSEWIRRHSADLRAPRDRYDAGCRNGVCHGRRSIINSRRHRGLGAGQEAGVCPLPAARRHRRDTQRMDLPVKWRRHLKAKNVRYAGAFKARRWACLTGD